MRRVFRPKKTSETLRLTGYLAVVIVVVVLVNIGLADLDRIREKNQIELVQDAITKAAVQCYALESQYPPSLQYLVDNYGITLDENKYIYHYRTIGSNMTPEIKVFPNTPRGGS